ncbi:DUF397 domain-containing protein [Streptomyces sp. NPDC088196]|uniref:DUF397 domain-containing protein n=1 Tax=Streptomyces sp. NPDC088196 TaxID=3154868 RepID=UPI00344ED4F0
MTCSGPWPSHRKRPWTWSNKRRTTTGTARSGPDVRDDLPGVVPVRDSEVPDGSALLIAGSAWVSFVGWVGAV